MRLRRCAADVYQVEALQRFRELCDRTGLEVGDGLFDRFDGAGDGMVDLSEFFFAFHAELQLVSPQVIEGRRCCHSFHVVVSSEFSVCRFHAERCFSRCCCCGIACRQSWSGPTHPGGNR